MVPKITLNRYGKRTFKKGAVTLWNSITDDHLKNSKDITTFNPSVPASFNNHVSGMR